MLKNLVVNNKKYLKIKSSIGELIRLLSTRQLTKMQSRPLRPLAIMPFGAAGTGKSTILNGLAGKPGHFKNSNTCEPGETK